MPRAYKQGKFKPLNPHKIIGDPTDIIFRSSWEQKVFHKLDQSSSVVKWGSECIVIPYISPKDNLRHRYFPDLIVVAKGKDGYITTMIEIKPHKQSVPPALPKTGKPTKRYAEDLMTYLINQAKWKAAEAFCDQRGIRFVVMTEADILGAKV